MTTKHANLPITFAELGALLGTEQMMKHRVIVHAGTDEKGHLPFPHDDAHEFNMDVTCRVSGCASVGCIGGTMAQIMGLNSSQADFYVRATVVNTYYKDYIPHSPALTPLFFPPDGYNCKKITLPVALKAIKQFRETGTVNWKKIPGFERFKYR